MKYMARKGKMALKSRVLGAKMGNLAVNNNELATKLER